MGSIRVTFPTDDDAERALEDAGFSLGRMQRDAPRGILFGDFDIQKWRNLSARDRAALDGHLCRHGPPGSPATVTLHSADHIPPEAISQVVAAGGAAQRKIEEAETDGQ